MALFMGSACDSITMKDILTAMCETAGEIFTEEMLEDFIRLRDKMEICSDDKGMFLPFYETIKLRKSLKINNKARKCSIIFLLPFFLSFNFSNRR